MDDKELKELQEKAKWLEREYREVCNTCHALIHKYEIGDGGDKVDQIVARYVDQQAQRIADLEAQNAALKAAIKPFAEFAEHIRPPNHLDTPIYGYNGVELTWRHFRDALLLKGDAE